MAHTPQQLRKLAQHCRYMAATSSIGFEQLLSMAKDFETEAEAEERQRPPLGSGRC
jgi:hypothetical protein